MRRSLVGQSSPHHTNCIRNQQIKKMFPFNYQIRQEENLKVSLNNKNIDSVKKDIKERPLKRKFNSLQIPKALEKALPFASKPKLYSETKKTPYLAQRTAMIMDKKEKQVNTLLQQVATIQNDQKEKRTAKQKANLAKKVKLEAKEQLRKKMK